MATITREKFLFTTQFAAKKMATTQAPVAEPESVSVAVPEPEPAPVMVSEEDLELARKLAFEEGREAGRADAETSLASRQLEATRSLSQHLETLLQQEASRAEHFDAVAAELALAMVSKLLPTWQRQHAETEITRLIKEALTLAPLPVGVTLHCHPDAVLIAERIAESLSASAPLTVKPDDALAHGDWQVEWQSGGLELSLTRALSALQSIITSHQPELVTPTKDNNHE